MQVAEQYPLYPAPAAGQALVPGVVGQPTSVQVSSTRGYHVISLIRKFLAAGFAPAPGEGIVVQKPAGQPVCQGGLDRCQQC